MHTEIDNFFNKVAEVYSADLPFVMYRKPNENLVSLMRQDTDELHELNNFAEKGFVFAPFNNTEKKILFPFLKCSVDTVEINNVNEIQVNLNSTVFNAIENFEILKEKHIKLVEEGLKAIINNKADKIVLSRIEVLKCNGFDVINAFKKMLKNYKNAFVYCWFHPKVGLWMGASPERLINIERNKFKTMALAGTQSYNGTTNVTWQHKELKEQKFVTDFILQNIKNSINNIETSKVYTVKAGSLLHLRTDISGELEDLNLLENLVNSLHPTPAVCGLPKQVATKFILQNEGYNRSYYSGYLGELNINNSTNLFVNLRCLKLENNEVSIYVGGGITAESNSVNEWNETVSKAKVMKLIL